jgi:starvation-inducible DNA-binding protein
MTTATATPQAPVDIGIGEKQRERVAQALSRVLADTYTLYLQTHNFHWNVTGPLFAQLHTLFETQYTELAAAVDEIAERIRALGRRAPGSYREFGKLSRISEVDGSPAALEMVAILAKANEAVSRSSREALADAQAADDEGSADLLIQRMKVHEKNAWMLRSLLEGQ